jgi:hypothetical protein
VSDRPSDKYRTGDKAEQKNKWIAENDVKSWSATVLVPTEDFEHLGGCIMAKLWWRGEAASFSRSPSDAEIGYQQGTMCPRETMECFPRIGLSQDGQDAQWLLDSSQDAQWILDSSQDAQWILDSSQDAQ